MSHSEIAALTNPDQGAGCVRLAASLLIGIWAAAGCGGGTSAGDVGSEASASAESVTLSWIQPSLNTDGSVLLDGVGYRVDYGSSPSSLSTSISVDGAGNTNVTIRGLSSGTYYFAVSTLNSAGTASSRSGVVSRTIP